MYRVAVPAGSTPATRCPGNLYCGRHDMRIYFGPRPHSSKFVRGVGRCGTLAQGVARIKSAIQLERAQNNRPHRLVELGEMLWHAERAREHTRQMRDYCRALTLRETVARRAVRAEGDLAGIIDLGGQARAARCRRVVGMMGIRR